MASGISDYFENKLIDAAFKNGTITFPGTWYVGLYTTMPGDSGPGVEVSTSGTGYSRIGVAQSASANWATTQGTANSPSTGTSGSTYNLVEIVFATPTSAWGTVVGFGLFDALSGGNMWYYGALSTPITIASGSTAKKFPVQSLIISHN